MKTELSAGGKREEGEEEKSYKVEFLPLDLSSFQSTTDFVRSFKEKNLPLHILINNAAVFAIPYSEHYPLLCISKLKKEFVMSYWTN